jgi:hypothetical protein
VASSGPNSSDLTWNALVAAAKNGAMIATAEGAGTPSDCDVIASSLAWPECFEAVFDRHATAIYRYLRRRVGAVLCRDVRARVSRSTRVRPSSRVRAALALRNRGLPPAPAPAHRGASPPRLHARSGQGPRAVAERRLRSSPRCGRFETGAGRGVGRPSASSAGGSAPPCMGRPLARGDRGCARHLGRDDAKPSAPCSRAHRGTARALRQQRLRSCRVARVPSTGSAGWLLFVPGARRSIYVGAASAEVASVELMLANGETLRAEVVQRPLGPDVPLNV